MIRLRVLNSEKSKVCWWQYLFFRQRVLHNKKGLTQRAPDVATATLVGVCAFLGGLCGLELVSIK